MNVSVPKGVAASAVATTSLIADEEYDPGVPGKACLLCNSAWPASEGESDLHHGHSFTPDDRIVLCANRPSVRGEW